MADRPSSPFSGLDKALIRSTSKQPAAEAVEQVPSETVREASGQRPTRSTERTDERSNERVKIRHSFDIYRDQLLELSDIQADIFRKTGKKPKVGELVQQALDAFITKHQGRTM